MFVGYRCNSAKVKEGIRIQSLRSKIAKVKSLFKCGTIKKFNILTTWNCLLLFILLFVAS